MFFKPEKATQLIAFFARERGGALSVIEASKLAYLADRAALDKYGLPILGDNFVQMAQGPVCSRTYDLMKGNAAPADIAAWQKFMEPRHGNTLALTRNFDDEELDQFSEAELELLHEVHNAFKHLKGFQLVDWVHKNCAEWEHPGTSSVTLPTESIFEALEKENSDELDERLRQFTRLAYKLKRMG